MLIILTVLIFVVVIGQKESSPTDTKETFTTQPGAITSNQYQSAQLSSSIESITSDFGESSSKALPVPEADRKTIPKVCITSAGYGGLAELRGE